MPIDEHDIQFFLDENLPKKLWKALRAAGYPTARAIDEHLRGQHDSTIFRQLRHRSVIITRDQDFLKTELFPPPHSGIIVVNLPKNTSVADVVAIVVNAANTLVNQELTNKVYVVKPEEILKYP